MKFSTCDVIIKWQFAAYNYTQEFSLSFSSFIFIASCLCGERKRRHLNAFTLNCFTVSRYSSFLLYFQVCSWPHQINFTTFIKSGIICEVCKFRGILRQKQATWIYIEYERTQYSEPGTLGYTVKYA